MEVVTSNQVSGHSPSRIQPVDQNPALRTRPDSNPPPSRLYIKFPCYNLL